jgi:putative membrane protein
MQFHAQQAARALILLGFSVLLYMMHYSGKIHLFINPKYLQLSQAAAFIFLILFFIQITRVWTVKGSQDHHACGHGYSCSDDHHHDHDHDHRCCSHEHDHFHDHGTSPFSLKKLLNYSIIVLPLLTGFMLPAKVLDSSIADKKGAMLSITGSSKTRDTSETKPADDQSGTKNPDSDGQTEDITSLPDDTAIVSGYENESTEEEYNKLMKQLEESQTIEFNDSIYSTYYEEISSNINKYVGRKVSLKGFVYKEEGFAENQLVVSRFLVTHCVADASIIGFLSEFPDAASIENDTWIRVEGMIETGSYMDSPIPVIKVTKWEQADEPEVPYLYPVSIRRN